MTGWLGLLGYLSLVAWAFSPWLRFAILPGLEPHRGIPLWDPPW